MQSNNYHPPRYGAESKQGKTMDIKIARLSAGLTQQELADKIGVKQSWVGKLEAGEIKISNITARKLLDLAAALGLDPRELL